MSKVLKTLGHMKTEHDHFKATANREKKKLEKKIKKNENRDGWGNQRRIE